MSLREFSQNPGEARQVADEGPVIATDRDELAYALLNMTRIGGCQAMA
jgi:hypothetical protein